MMRVGVSASASVTHPSSSSKIRCKFQNPSINAANYSHHHYQRISLSSQSQSPRARFPRLCCSTSPGSPGSEGQNVAGESDTKTVLDAFFLGKALGEALTERIESAVGEFLSTIGRLQSERQKQIQNFQEDVLERAKRAKEKAAREALEDEGQLVLNPTTVNESVTNGSSSSTMSTRGGSMTPATPVSVDNPEVPASSVDDDGDDQDSVSSIPIDK